LFIEIQEEIGSFNTYLWGFVGNNPVVNHFQKQNEVPTATELSDLIAKDFKKRGFKFLGSTTVYAYLQAMGIVDDHLDYCKYKINRD